MYSSPSGLAPAISPASPSPKLHSHSFSWGPSLSLESIANWHFLTLERNKYNSPDLYILCCPLGSAFKLSSWPLNRCQQVSPSDSRSGRSAHEATLHKTHLHILWMKHDTFLIDETQILQNFSPQIRPLMSAEIRHSAHMEPKSCCPVVLCRHLFTCPNQQRSTANVTSL